MKMKKKTKKKSVRKTKIVMMSGFRMATEQENKHKYVKGKINK